MITGKQSITRSALMLALIAVIGSGMLAGIHSLTGDRIAEQQRRVILEQLNQVFPQSLHSNMLHEDLIEVRDAAFFRHDEPVKVYRARNTDRATGIVMELVAPDGYNGDIRLLVGIRDDGVISGVRVIAHRETPGLGDPIDHARSDWILGFDDRSLSNPEARHWAVRRDGGEFEQFTGATITPRAVVEAVQRALEYFSAHREALYQARATGENHEP
jgi:electron transport complex protein RnfG